MLNVGLFSVPESYANFGGGRIAAGALMVGCLQMSMRVSTLLFVSTIPSGYDSRKV